MQMTIRSITIQNIKGIHNETYSLDIIPNKPSLLVAPNGFGKSSIAIAFNSLNSNRIDLDDDHLHEGNKLNKPQIAVQLEKSDGTLANLVATENTNTISDIIDCFVINAQVRAIGKKLTFGGHDTVIAYTKVDPIVLFKTIPTNTAFPYSISQQKADFGSNGKCLPNIEAILVNPAHIEVIYQNLNLIRGAQGKRVVGKIVGFRERVNQQTGSAADIIKWITDNELQQLESIEYLHGFTELLIGFDLPQFSIADKYLASIQIFNMYADSKDDFLKACKRKLYEFEKECFRKVIADFNPTWKNIRPKEQGDTLLLEFPKTHHISNGQRDILCLITLLHCAKRKLLKEYCILIIDEIFDYLDDANLITIQYYITRFIDEYTSSGKKLYPIILTHLNPNYFKHFAFSKQHVYFLQKSTAVVEPHLINLLKKRENATIKYDVDKYLLHYHPDTIDKRAEFRALNLKETWGELNNFDLYIEAEMQKYLSNTTGYDPFAVCNAVRKKIETIVYNRIADTAFKDTFLSRHKTRLKLEYAESIGIPVPEIYYLLGIIYNDAMHWKDNMDNISPLASKLENITIKNLIKKVFV